MSDNVLFLTACATCKAMAKNTGVSHFVFNGEFGVYEVLRNYHDDWLFRAYPGGRTVLSMEGKELT